MTRPRILYLVHRVPYPPNRGDRIRSYNLLKFLADRSDVWLGTLADEPVSEETHQRLNRLCKEVAIYPLPRLRRWANGVCTLARGGCMTEGLFFSPQLRDAVSTWGGHVRFDAVVAVCSSMLSYVEGGELADVPLVVDLIDVDSEKWFQLAENAAFPKRHIYRLEGQRVRQLEQRLGTNAEAVTLVSEVEADLYRSMAPKASVYGIVNGVDLQYFAPPAGLRSAANDCVFVGVLDYPPNVEGVLWFARHVWPDVRRRHPAARFVVVGKNPVPALRFLARQDSSIRLAANVPDVRPYLRDAACVVAPLRVARGIQNKVLEAMAMGRAVIASPEARTGLEAQPGQHLLEARTAEDWIDSMDRLLSDAACREKLRHAARDFVERHHNWRTCLSPFAQILGLESDLPLDVGQPRKVPQTASAGKR